MDPQKLQQGAAQLQAEVGQAVAGFKAKGWEHFKKALVVAAALGLVGYAALYKTTAAQLRVVKRKAFQMREVAKVAQDYRDLKAKLAAVSGRFPTEAERKDWLFNLVLASAKAEGIAIESISSQKETERGDLPFVKVSIDVTGRGAYHGVGALLARLEGTGKFIQVEGFNLSKVSSGEGAGAPTGMNTATLTVATVIPKGMAGL